MNPSRAPMESDHYRGATYDRTAPPTVVAVPEGAPPESLRWAVEAALAERHWNVEDRAPGRIQASVHSNGSGEDATIAVTYGPGGIQIAQLAASATPHRFDRWVRLLASNINKHVAEIGMARVAPWAAPSPVAAPPPVAPPPPPAAAPEVP